ncbi:hypothetical protein JG687_00004916 [Phytophthora cactorum]|uniref:Uncharacterized protein n=1 Tax=Phytophthora cactorum TaxID=29920 RepID=A0A8T1URY8_9STRA|nr:hypothetical protein JG687_00004916 [Phytophthora cactorum]
MDLSRVDAYSCIKYADIVSATHVRSVNRCNACRMTTNESLDHHRRFGTARTGSLTVDRHHRQKRHLALSHGGTKTVSTATSMPMSGPPRSSIQRVRQSVKHHNFALGRCKIITEGQPRVTSVKRMWWCGRPSHCSLLRPSRRRK